MRRKRMSKRRSARSYRKGKRVNKRNFRTTTGGGRL